MRILGERCAASRGACRCAPPAWYTPPVSHRAQRLAELVRKRLGLDSPPANASLLLAYAPVEVVHVDWPLDLAGMLVLRDRRALIGLNRRHTAARRHFSFWHEVGHYVLHREGGDARAIACGAARLPDAVDSEPEADAFAAHLLMPEDWLARCRVDARDVTVMARRLRVSPEALALRLRELGLSAPPRPYRPFAGGPPTHRASR